MGGKRRREEEVGGKEEEGREESGWNGKWKNIRKDGKGMWREKTKYEKSK